MYPGFQLFGRFIGTYAICSFIGLLLCGFVGYKLGKKKDICFENIVLVMVSLSVGMLIGGHLLYGVTHILDVIDIFKHISKYSAKEFLLQMSNCFGGMVYYGGFIGAAIAVFIHSKISKEMHTADIMDIFSVSIPLFHMFGRIGCFLGGCCYGIESRWGFITHNNPFYPELNDVVRLPVQLIEAAVNLCLFAVLLSLFSKNKHRGNLLYIYLIFYSTVRFILEFYRGDVVRGFWAGLSTSQWISIILFVFALSKLLLKKRKLAKAVGT